MSSVLCNSNSTEDFYALTAQEICSKLEWISRNDIDQACQLRAQTALLELEQLATNSFKSK